MIKYEDLPNKQTNFFFYVYIISGAGKSQQWDFTWRHEKMEEGFFFLCVCVCVKKCQFCFFAGGEFILYDL